MTAHDIIIEPGRRPESGRAEVADYLHGAAAAQDPPAPRPVTVAVQFVSPGEAERLGQEILLRQPEVFRRLSQ